MVLVFSSKSRLDFGPLCMYICGAIQEQDPLYHLVDMLAAVSRLLKEI